MPSRRKLLAVLLVVLAVTGLAWLLVKNPDLGNIELPGFLGGGGTTTGTSTGTTSSTGTISGTTLPPNPQNPTTTTTTSGTGTGGVSGLDQALAGNSGLNNFINARNCGLVGLGYVQFCDTFPDNALDAKKWKSYGTITVTPGTVVFENATMVSKGGFYYGKFATFRVEVNPQQPGQQGPCPLGYIMKIKYDAQYNRYVKFCAFDYAVWGFARGSSANAIQWGLYWEQNITSIRSHTRYTDFSSRTQIDEVSAWRPVPRGVTEYALNWNVDSHGAFVQFIYKAQNGTIVYFAKHTTAIPKTFLYLFAASNGTHFVLHRVIILPAWRNGDLPLVNLVIRPELLL